MPRRSSRTPRCWPRRSRSAALAVVSGGTDTHLALIDLTPLGVTGKDADEALERAGDHLQQERHPQRSAAPVKTSGIRVGSPAGTTRGFGVAEFREIGNMVADVLDGLRKNGEQGDAQVEANVRERVARCARASRSIRRL
jgi:glycine hydroxymethyltransferase